MGFLFYLFNLDQMFGGPIETHPHVAAMIVF